MTEIDETQPGPAADDADDGGAEDQTSERGRSTIAFPYASLADAERIAQELRNFGDTATPEGLAKALDQKPRSGAFRQKLSAARIFGLVRTQPNAVILTALGKSILDPERQDVSRVQAFLNVPLYKALYDKYTGDLLPATQFLEDEIVRLGVSEKQADTARQVFQRSGELAGFFKRGANRLIKPEVTETGSGSKQTKNTPRDSTGLPEPVVAMVESVLRDGETWSAEQVKAVMDGARLTWKAFSA